MEPTEAAQSAQPVRAEMLLSEQPREASPEVSATELDTLVEGNTTFAVDLYRALRETEGNLFFSPYSISTALAMTYAGAEGQTATEMAETLHFTLSQEELHAAFNALDQRLTAEGSVEEEEDGESFTLRIANSIWGEREYTFREPFLDRLARNYGAGLRVVSFKTAPEEARQAINAWVSEETEGKIEDLIPEGSITDMTRLVLANAIYFKAQWLHTFDEKQTQEGTFTTIEGDNVEVPMMRWSQPEMVPYTKGQGFQAIELPYQDGSASMVIVVPDAGTFRDFESAFDAKTPRSIVAGMETRGVALTMPKFEYDAEVSLVGTLRELEMTTAFEPGEANFSGMSESNDLFISDVFHKAYVAVDEEGTEAAAATAVVVGVTSMPVQDVALAIDRPFIYFIRDQENGAVLFLGRVVDPS